MPEWGQQWRKLPHHHHLEAGEVSFIRGLADGEGDRRVERG